MYKLNKGTEKYFSVTIIDQENRPISEYQDNINVKTLELMLKAEYITIRNKTIQKKSTRIDEFGNVYFYGVSAEIESI